MLGEHLLEYPRADKYYRAYMYVYDLLAFDLIMKKDNCFYPDFIPPIKKALEAVLSHSRKMYLEPDEWVIMTEVAERVKAKLPKIKIVPEGQEYKYFSY
ncbi:MAG: hypothetical protein K2J79_00585 [Ruminiclostridium sp.]|nr:hypothetical protein [Ruminiclostridium sp.]